METSSRKPVPCTVCGKSALYFGVKNQYKHFLCATCGHLFVWPVPENFRTIYSEDYFAGASAGFGYPDYDRDKEPMTAVFQDYLVRIERAVGRVGNMLDVGAATGFFLDLARQRGWAVKGIEASAHAAAVAVEKGLDVRAGIMEDLDFHPDSFDAITMWDVIEHMENPDAAIASAAKMLRTGGVLAINTPDSRSRIARLAGMRWHLIIPPEHLNLFSQRSLGLMLERHGFDLQVSTKIGKRFTLQYVFQTLSHIVGPGFTTVARRLRGTRLGSCYVSINLRDNMFLLAKKR